jgi:probable HAF family extracellular repeat protein
MCYPQSMYGRAPHRGKVLRKAGGKMKSRRLKCFTAITLLAVLAIPASRAAGDETGHRHHKHHHYKLIDMGTFGGLLSGVNEPLNYVPAVGRRGQVVGFSANSVPQIPTNNPTACFGASNVTHGFEFQDGSVIDLGSLAGDAFCSDAGSSNKRGEIPGISENGLFDPLLGLNQVRAVIWKRGQISDLGTFGGNHSWSFGMNDSEEVVGMALNAVPDPFSLYGFTIFGSSSSTQTRAFLWEQYSGMQDLGTLGGSDAWAFFINERGQIAGNSYTNSTANPSSGFPTLDPFFFHHGKMIDIGTLGGVVGFVGALNNLGEVIGGSSTAENPAACYVPTAQSIEFGNPGCDPFLWDRRKLIDLATSTRGGSPQTSDGINDLGEIVGAATFPTQPYDAYLWRKGYATDVGHLDGDCASEAWALNRQSQVVGDSFVCAAIFQHHAFLWENGSLVDLNSLIPLGSSLELVFATSINDRGEIAGNGVPPGVSPGDVFNLGHAFLLVPCDENHPGVEGCDYSLVEGSDTVAANRMSTAQNPTTVNPWVSGAVNPLMRFFGHRTMP